MRFAWQLFFRLVLSGLLVAGSGGIAGPINWGKTELINNVPLFLDGGEDARGIRPGKFGSQYGRLTRLTEDSWLCVYTIYDNYGYPNGDAHGLFRKGTALQVARSRDHGHSWRPIATLRDNNRDLDNGELLTLPNGSLRLAYRSVRWQQSYRLCVSGSEDGGVTWQPLSQPEANEGAPGSLGHPDKGVYEPGFCRLADGTLALFYANEKHVTETPAYSQIIAERLSHDNGLTWGPEIWVAWDTNAPSERPGMPVATRLADGRFMAVFEVVGKNEAKVFCKISPDGQTWAPGLGLVVPAQIGGPYVVALTNHWLAVTSNSGNVSLSEDYGATWRTNDPPVWGQGQVGHYWWLSIYQTGPEEIAVIGSCPRLIGGTDIRIRFGTLPGLLPPSP